MDNKKKVWLEENSDTDQLGSNHETSIESEDNKNERERLAIIRSRRFAVIIHTISLIVMIVRKVMVTKMKLRQ